MNKKNTALISVLMSVIFIFVSCSSDKSEEQTTGDANTVPVSYSGTSAPDMTDAVSVEFSNSGVKSSGSAVTCSESDAVITGVGVYVITGSSSDGSVTVNAPDSEVWLVLKNADITCKDPSPLYVYKSKKTYV